VSTSGAKDFRWRLWTCWGDEGRLGGLVMGYYGGRKNGRGEGPISAWFRGFGKVWGWGSTFTWRVGGQYGELIGGVWFVKIKRGNSGSFVVWMGNGVENRSIMAYDKANARWELGSLMRHDKLRDNMGCLMPTIMRNRIRQNHIIVN